MVFFQTCQASGVNCFRSLFIALQYLGRKWFTSTGMGVVPPTLSTESDPLIDKKMVAELERSNHAPRDENKIRLVKSLAKMYGGADRQYLNYYGPPRTFTTMPFYQALRLGEESASEHKIDLKGRAVFVGLSEILLTERRDSFYTAFSKTNGVFISGVEIAATAFANLLQDTSVKPIGTHYYILIIFAWGILVGVICRMVAPVLARDFDV